jgi:four helix bundle protein
MNNLQTKLIVMLNLSHKKLDVYQISLNSVKEVYKATRQFPKEEQFVLISQIRRAAISVACNIAEGASRISKGEKKRFYEISRSSAVEMDTQFEIAIILEYYKKGQMAELEQYLESTFRMLSKMIDNLDSNPTRH